MAQPDAAQRFEALVLPHMNSAFNLARWLTRNDHDAKDVVQEAYLRAFRFFGGFRGSDARPWLLRIVRNTFYTWHRQNNPAATLEFDEELHGECGDAATDASPEALLLLNERRQQVWNALRGLSLEYREVVVLRELEDLSYKEIASIVDIPIGTVMSRLGRGRRQLAAALADQEE